jgi:iron complex outermembrane receptor protein
MKLNPQKLALYLTSAVVALSAAPAMAQSKNTSTLGEVVVTARRMEERLQDVPISMTVYNPQQLKQLNIVNPNDLALYTPSVSANTNFGSDNASLAIRGFVQDIGTQPAVGMYFADVVAPRGASQGLPAGDGAGAGAFFDLQNVQVLKGPQGTLFGRNTTGGAILLVPQKPTNHFEGFVEGSLGNYNMRRVEAVVNVPVNDQFRIRLGVDHQSRDGYLKNTSGIGPGDFNDVNYTALRGSMVWELNPDLENYTIFSWTKSNTNGSFDKIIAADPRISLGSFAAQQLADQAAKGDGFYDGRQDMPSAYSKLKQWQIINTTTWHYSDTTTVKNILSYARLTDDLRGPIFGTAFSTPAIPPLGLPSFRFGFSNSTPPPGGHTADEETWTDELQIQGRSFNDRLTWQGGFYMELANPVSTVGAQSPVVISCSNSDALQCYDILGFLGTLAAGTPVHAGAVNVTLGRTTFRNYAFYAQGTYKLNDKFKLTGGFRYTSDEERNTSTQRTLLFGYPVSLATFQPIPPAVIASVCTNPTAPPSTCTLHYEEKSKKPTWLIDLDYTPSPDLLVYAKYARGYRAGTIAPNVTPPYNLISPESVDSYEAGFKYSFSGQVNGILNAAAFYNDFKDQQIQLGFLPAPGVPISPTAAPINAGKSKIYGLELEGAINPLTGLTLRAAYTYLHTRIESIPTFVAPIGSLYVVSGSQKVGDPLPLSPRHKVVLSASYTLPLDENIGKVTVGGDFTHTAKQLINYNDREVVGTVFENLGTIPAYNIVNLNLSWDNIAGKPLDLQLFATNVNGEKYYTYVSGIAGGTGFETAQLGAPRMYGARLRYRWGSR